ncbi:MAG: SH3 domain-containing protein [Rhodobacteraceae bacterium]|nr:SH3 domain-containing protein [Paracoccaceae bacterium]
MIRLLAALFVLWPICVAAADLPALFNVTDVASNDVLNIRETPSASSAIIGSFAPNMAGIEVTGLSENGKWGRVNTGERAGWVSMRFMEAAANGHWADPNTKLSCFGTEPFWSVVLSPTTRSAEYTRPDAAPVTTEITQVLISAPGFPPAAWMMFEKGALDWVQLNQASCNDGMSDREFGISAQLAVSQPMKDPLTLPNYVVNGCCSVIPH